MVAEVSARVRSWPTSASAHGGGRGVMPRVSKAMGQQGALVPVQSVWVERWP